MHNSGIRQPILPTKQPFKLYLEHIISRYFWTKEKERISDCQPGVHVSLSFKQTYKKSNSFSFFESIKNCALSEKSDSANLIIGKSANM